MRVYVVSALNQGSRCWVSREVSIQPGVAVSERIVMDISGRMRLIIRGPGVAVMCVSMTESWN